jgi:hypothetical protein
MKKIKFKKNVVISVGIGVVTFITSVICLSSGCSKKVEKDPDCVQVVTTTTSTTGTTSTCTSTSTTESGITTTSSSTTPTTTSDAVVTTKKLAVASKNSTTKKASTTKETSTATSDVSTNTTAQTVPSTTQQIVEYVVFKPSTHYIHRSTCRWNDDTAYKVDNTNGIEARKCTECNPNMEIVSEYVPPVVESGLPITETERILLCNLVGREYGSDYISVYEKAKVVAVVMNRVNDSRFPNTIYEVLTQPYQFSGYIPNYSYTYQVTDSVVQAVDYYFAHPEEFGNWLYFYGDGTWNYFS